METCHLFLILIGFFHGFLGCRSFYFTGNSSLILNSTINLASSGFTFQFRTCKGGILVEQGGNFKVALNRTSTLEHSRLYISINQTVYTLRTQFSLDTNYLVTVFLDTENSNLFGVSGLFSSNISLPSSIKDVIVTDRPVLGSSFTGCIISGKNIDLSKGVSNGVQDGCILEDRRPCSETVCPVGFTGRNCEVNINDCASVPCHSFSTCIDLVNGFRCLCGPRWTGRTCSTFLGSLCTNNPCQNSGVCQESQDRNNYTCVCSSRFTGRHCELQRQPCLPNPCLNGGVCSNATGGLLEYTCNCTTGFAGAHCERNIDDCASHPCRHGSCVDGVNNFTCNCENSGYTGKTCSEDINECQVTKPCQNNATCINNFGGYRCTCTSGWTGTNCDVDIKECQASVNPCRNNGTCVEQIGGFRCTCRLGYTGRLCETNINDCLPAHLCGNGTCKDGVNNYTCQCFPGFSGRNCEINNNECASNPCLNGGNCMDGINRYTCNCPPAYTGVNCENFTNPCSPNPCLNNGTCMNNSRTGFECNCTDTSFGGDRCQFALGHCFPRNPCQNGNCSDNGNTYNCTCHPGYKGVNCSVDINECSPNPCRNGGNCQNLPGSFKCNCNEFTEGVHCENDINECKKSVCKNNGTCYNRINDGFDCACGRTGFTGPTCEIRVFPCKNTEGQLGRNPCNNGTCIDGRLDFTCRCFPGFSGDRCEVNINECNFGYCRNNASCTDRINDYQCTCKAGFTDKNCSTNIDECQSSPCLNNGTCRDLVNAFTCSCRVGFNGTRCQNDIDWCASNPCVHGGNCTDGIETHTCTCYPGYTGRNCEVDINECQSNPCQNQGKCIEKSNITALRLVGKAPPGAELTFRNRDGYICECLKGTNGTNCEINFDDCLSSPCLNNGTCHDLINDYNCSCRQGFTGKNCSVDINECASSPCLNNGTCKDEIGRFVCQCAQNFTGNRCETSINQCNSVRPCKNGATCVVVGLGYRCECLSGFTGTDCELSTNINFAGSGYWRTERSGTQFKLQFRTTLQSGVVFHYVDGSQSGVVRVNEGRLWAVQFPSKQVKELSREVVNDGAPHSVQLQIFSSFLLFTVDNRTTNVTGVNFSNASYWIGGVQMTSRLDGTSVNNFTGCIQDVRVNNVVLAPSKVGSVNSAIVGNCTKTRFCLSNTCTGNGNCVDSWLDVTCSCNRRFFGDDCGQEILPFTFAVATTATPPTNTTARRRRRSISTPSPANATRFILYEQKTNFTDNTSLSFFVRTRDLSGILTLIASHNSQTGSAASLTYLTLQLSRGLLVFSYRHQSEVINVSRSVPVNNGQWQEIEISRSTVKVNKNTVFTPNIRTSFPVRFIYFGGVDNHTFFRNALSTTSQFQGCIQDIIFQGNTVTNQNIPGRSTRGVNATQANVGCNGTDVCASSPCLFGGSCNDLWNAFNCTCKPGFAGTRCSTYGCALQNTCANGTECLDIPNLPGHTACASNVTFNGVNQSVVISAPTFNTSNIQTNISFRLRTRRADALILVTSNSSGFFLGVGLSSGKVRVHYNLGSGVKSLNQVGASINDGKWHQVEIQSKTGKTTIKVDGTEAGSSGEMILGRNWNYLVLSSGVTVGLTTHSALNSTFKNPYKGCLNKFFIGQSVLHLGVSVPSGPRVGCMSDNPCQQRPCTRGTCTDIFDDFSCLCPAHYTSKRCQQTVNVTCAITPSPCQNGGRCQNVTQPSRTKPGEKFSDIGFDFFKCQCAAGYTGPFCKNTTNECSPNPCIHGNCVDKHLNYSCQCFPGFTGRNCSINIDDCVGNSCANNATCKDGVQNYTCECKDGFRGRKCDQDVNECTERNPCINNSTCTNFDGGYNCTCRNGFWGTNCQFNASQSCLSNPCLNNANCSANSSGFTCKCMAGFSGRRCETDIHECAVTPCQNNASCIDSHSNRSAPHFPGYRCNCLPQHTGRNCQTDIDPCDVSPCRNNGTCIKLSFNMHNCNCTAQFRGQNCDTPRTACDSNPCLNNATCVPSGKNFTCTCALGFDGKYCQNNTNPCLRSPCKNSGVCQPILRTCAPGRVRCNNRVYDRFNCACASEWLGDTCTIKNPCMPNPCKNSGTCNYTLGATTATHSCTCTSDFSGTNCETEDDSKLGLYIGIGVGAGVLVLLIILIVCLLKDKGGMHGTYSPKKEERQGQVEMKPVEIPKPRQERLI